LQVQLVWAFDAHELNWPPNRPVPVGLADLRRTDNWRLVGYARPDNNREAREVFARLKSVREQLIRQGFARDRIGIELRSTAELPAADEFLPRHVLMVTPQPSMQ
jgi:endonuclease YncB( thermonuclease family)